MSPPPSFTHPRKIAFLAALSPLNRSQRGVALVLVLAFTVLLIGLVLAFFTQATSHRQVTEGNTSGVLADVIARSAAEIVVGDLRQDIADGSTALGAPPIYARPRRTGSRPHSPGCPRHPQTRCRIS